MPGGVSMEQIHLPLSYQYKFDQILWLRVAFGNLIATVAPLIDKSISSLKNLKMYLRRCFQELRPQLSQAKSFGDVTELVEDKCTIVNIDCLEAIVNHFNIEEAKEHISYYKMKVDEFSKEIKSRIYKDFMTGPSTLLKCETIEFTVEWATDERTLSDIRELLSYTFGDMADRVIVRSIKEGNISIAHMYLSVTQ